MAYRDFASVPLTGADSIEQGAVGLKHLDAPLFQAIQQIKLHTHSGIDSLQLQPYATPYVLKSLGPQQREEHGLANGAGSVSFTLPFQSAPFVLIAPISSTMPYITNVTTTGFTINAAGCYWLAIGR